MTLLTALATDTFVPQGSKKNLRLEILTTEGNAFNLTGHTVHMVLSPYRTGSEPVLQVNGDIIIAADGKVQFAFEPDDTKDLLAIAYSADVWVVETATEDAWPAWSGRIGITSVIPLEEEEA